MIVLTATRVQNPIGPCWVPLHSVGVVTARFALEGRRELYLAFLEVLGYVAQLPLDVELIVLVEYVKHILRHGLNYRFLNAIDSIIEVSHQNKQVRLHAQRHDLVLISRAADELSNHLVDVIVPLVHSVLPRVEVSVDEDQFLACDRELRLDSALVAHHATPARRDGVRLNLTDQRYQLDVGENDQVRRLQRDRPHHGEFVPQARLDQLVHRLLVRLEDGAHDGAERFLRPNHVEVVMHVLWKE